MKSLLKLKTFLVIIVLTLSVLVLPDSFCSTAEAASKKVNVKKVTAVNALTGSSRIYLAKGRKAVLRTTVIAAPNNSANKKVTYKSSDKKVAIVSSKGVIIGKKAGTAKITVASKKNSKKKAVVRVNVLKGSVTGIALDRTSGTLTVGDTVKLKADVKTSKGGRKNVVWSSSNTKAASVKGGTVKAVGAGTAVITVKAADGSGKKAACKMTVREKGKPETPVNKPGTPEMDKAVLQKIIEEQIARGAHVPRDLNDEAYIWENKRLIGINWTEKNLQGALSLEGLTALTSLYCNANNLSSLDVNKNMALENLDCSENALDGLDVSNNKALSYLVCFRNPLGSLDVTHNKDLAYLFCYENGLSELDVSRNTALINLTCWGNRLGSLDLRNNPVLTELDCDDTVQVIR